MSGPARCSGSFQFQIYVVEISAEDLKIALQLGKQCIQFGRIGNKIGFDRMSRSHLPTRRFRATNRLLDAQLVQFGKHNFAPANL